MNRLPIAVTFPPVLALIGLLASAVPAGGPRAVGGQEPEGDHPLVVGTAAAAEGGKEATRDMLATAGKARSLGERSIGHVDPGAVSVTLIFAAMDDFLAGR